MKWPNVNRVIHSPKLTLENTALEKSNFKVGDHVLYGNEKVEIVSYERLLLLVDHQWHEDYPQTYIPIKLSSGRLTGVSVRGLERPGGVNW